MGVTMRNTISLFINMKGAITNRKPLIYPLIFAVYLVVPFFFGCTSKTRINLYDNEVVITESSNCRFYYKDDEVEVDYDSRKENILDGLIKQIDVK